MNGRSHLYLFTSSATMGNDHRYYHCASYLMYVFGLLRASNVSENLEKEGRQRRQGYRFTSSQILWIAQRKGQIESTWSHPSSKNVLF